MGPLFDIIVSFFLFFTGYGFSLGGSMFIKEIDKNGMVARQGELKSGDVILKVCIYAMNKCLVLCFESQLLINYSAFMLREFMLSGGAYFG